MAANWYALRTKPRQERSVQRRLAARDDLQVYLPALHVRARGRRGSTMRPFFPGYLFVQVDLEQLEDNVLRWSEGIVGLVRYGDEPAVVAERLIRDLQQRLGALGTVDALALEGLAPGDDVEVVSGPLAGYEGVFDARIDGAGRVQILLAFLGGHPQRVQLDGETIRKKRGRRRPRRP